MRHPRPQRRSPIRRGGLVNEPPQPGASAAQQPAGDTTADTAGRLGEHVGRFAVLAMRRLEQMVSDAAVTAEQTMARSMTAAHGTAAPTGGAQRDAGDSAPTAPDAAAPAAPASATARADAMVDRAGAQLGTLTALVSHQLRRAAALAREEAEDVWAEAQQIRAAQRRDPGGRQGDIS